MTDAAATIEPDVPDPARLLRRRNGVRGDRIVRPRIGQLRRDRPIAEQHVATRSKRYLQGLADQLGTKARAVDIEIGVEQTVALGPYRADRAIGIEQHLGHGIGQMPDAIGHRLLAQHAGQRHRVEVKGIVERTDIVGMARQFRRAMAVGRLLLRIGDLVPILRAPMAQDPIGQEFEPVARIRHLKRVRIMVGRALARRVSPVHELRALLEGRTTAAHQGRLVNPDRRKRPPDSRERPLAHAEHADLARFDERDLRAPRQVGAKPLGKVTRGQPPRGTAPYDQHSLSHQTLPRHRLPISVQDPIGRRCIILRRRD